MYLIIIIYRIIVLIHDLILLYALYIITWLRPVQSSTHLNLPKCSANKVFSSVMTILFRLSYSRQETGHDILNGQRLSSSNHNMLCVTCVFRCFDTDVTSCGQIISTYRYCLSALPQASHQVLIYVIPRSWWRTFYCTYWLNDWFKY
jgi:hypothetical protein